MDHQGFRSIFKSWKIVIQNPDLEYLGWEYANKKPDGMFLSKNLSRKTLMDYIISLKEFEPCTYVGY